MKIVIDIDQKKKVFEDRIRDIDCRISSLQEERRCCVDNLELLSNLYSFGCASYDSEKNKVYTIREQVIQVLGKYGECKRAVLIREVQGSEKAISDVLYRMQVNGEVIRPKHGFYKLTGYKPARKYEGTESAREKILRILQNSSLTPMEISEQLPQFSYSGIYNTLKRLKVEGILYSDSDARYYFVHQKEEE